MLVNSLETFESNERKNTDPGKRWDTTRKETDREAKEEHEKNNALCFSAEIHRRKEIDEKYRCGSRIVCAWMDIWTSYGSSLTKILYRHHIYCVYLNQFVLYSYRAPIGYYFFTYIFFTRAHHLSYLTLSYWIDIVDNRTSLIVR